MKNLGNKNKSNNFDSLSERIANFEAIMTSEKKKQSPAQMPVAGIALAGRVATELVAGIAVGTFLGWLIDRWLETTPIFMLILFFFGAAGGLMNIWRLLTGRGMSAGYFNENKKNKDNSSKQSRKKKIFRNL